tara:strand:- start:272 stop:430 length:159 start_codon:yes stop_codon:yes gene_type:complete
MNTAIRLDGCFYVGRCLGVRQANGTQQTAKSCFKKSFDPSLLIFGLALAQLS